MYNQKDNLRQWWYWTLKLVLLAKSLDDAEQSIIQSKCQLDYISTSWHPLYQTYYAFVFYSELHSRIITYNLIPEIIGMPRTLKSKLSKYLWFLHLPILLNTDWTQHISYFLSNTISLGEIHTFLSFRSVQRFKL